MPAVRLQLYILKGICGVFKIFTIVKSVENWCLIGGIDSFSGSMLQKMHWSRFNSSEPSYKQKFQLQAKQLARTGSFLFWKQPKHPLDSFHFNI